jgi:hypothetical protein
MNKQDWVSALLLGLICLSPEGAVAYYRARAEEEDKRLLPVRAAHRVVSDKVGRSAVVELAVL